MKILINWYDVFVQNDHPDTGCDPDTGHHRGDRMDARVFSSISDLNDTLEGHDLPPIDEWEPNDDTPGQYHWSRSENDSGCAITDDEYRAKPEEGLYLVDFTLNLSAYEDHPLTPADIHKAVTA